MNDLISRKALIEDVLNSFPQCRGTRDAFVKHIQFAPTIEAEPVRHGEWKQDADGDWYCTHCDNYSCICDSGKDRTYRKPYCPNCGAKMDGDPNA